MTNILIVDDEVVFAGAVQRKLQRDGYECKIVNTLLDAHQILDTKQNDKDKFWPDLILLDMRLPDGDGTNLLENVDKKIPVIVITAYGDIESAVSAMRLGASDYLTKPLDLKELGLVISKVLNNEEIRNQLSLAKERDKRLASKPILIGNSPAMEGVRNTIKRIAAIDTPSPPNVLILGETGSGKDLLASLIHIESGNLGRPFVQVDCPALNHEQIEAQLFGEIVSDNASKSNQTRGLIETAEDGTLFLNEIAEIPLVLQSKLLHVIEHRTIQALGSNKQNTVEARFIASSNRPLASMVRDGNFRGDLFYRLNVLTVEIPPLRDRKEDIPILVSHFSQQTSRRYGYPDIELDETALEAMHQYHWPGNVRELRYLVERSVLLQSSSTISAEDLGLFDGLKAEAPVNPTPDPTTSNLTLISAERNMIEKALTQNKGNISKAARSLGITRMTLRYRMGKHRIAKQ